MYMHGKECRCPHHIVARVFRVLAGLAALGFFIAAFRTLGLFGWGAGGYFESAIMLVIMGEATKSCNCCHHGCGCVKADGDGAKVCNHPDDCTCGNCDRCK